MEINKSEGKLAFREKKLEKLEEDTKWIEKQYDLIEKIKNKK